MLLFPFLPVSQCHCAPPILTNGSNITDGYRITNNHFTILSYPLYFIALYVINKPLRAKILMDLGVSHMQ